MEYKDIPLIKRLDWINTFYLLGIPVGVVWLVPKYFHQTGGSWAIGLFALAFAVIQNLGITGGYHRLFAHKSYRARGWVKVVYLLVGASAFQGSALKWASDHRRHHKFVDTEKDPYNINQGFFWAHMGWLFVKDDPQYLGKFEPDLVADRMIAFQHKYYLPIALVTGFAFPTLVGWAMGSALGGLAMGGFLRLLVTNHGTFCINSLCHMIGRQPYTDTNSARDSFIMAVVACGEGYHNYHHYFQWDYRNGIYWYQWDPTKWLVKGLSYFGQTYDLKQVPASLILEAKLRMDEKRLLARGIPSEWVSPFRMKVEEAQNRLRELRDEYRQKKIDLKASYEQKKSDLRASSQDYLRAKKAEIRQARREFRAALQQWMINKRRLPALLAA